MAVPGRSGPVAILGCEPMVAIIITPRTPRVTTEPVTALAIGRILSR
jgi:hypothetical protein